MKSIKQYEVTVTYCRSTSKTPITEKITLWYKKGDNWNVAVANELTKRHPGHSVYSWEVWTTDSKVLEYAA